MIFKMNQHFQSAQRIGKTAHMLWMLKFKLIKEIQDDLPSEPFVLWKGDEIITWRPTGEVVSRKI